MENKLQSRFCFVSLFKPHSFTNTRTAWKVMTAVLKHLNFVSEENVLTTKIRFVWC